MTTTTQRNEAGAATAVPRAPERRVERRVGLPSGRAVIGGLLMAVAAVGTFLAYTNATADDTIDVLIAARSLSAGETITADDLAMVAVELPGEVRGLFGTTEAAVGRQVVAPVDEGEFLQASATVTPVEGDEALEVSVALPGSRAVGRLHSGERVDVFSTWSGDVTELVAVDARVLEVSGASGPVLSGSEQVIVRLALADFDQVEAIVHAQAAGDITMIRAAIGTEVQDVGREYRPLVGTPRAADAAAADEDATDDEGDD
ncbi:MAG: SAF domain-containing protein [Acidimicrobiales bacterium]|nr:SAF domain-containing protein [Acidimicrobiales bacterium]